MVFFFLYNLTLGQSTDGNDREVGQRMEQIISNYKTSKTKTEVKKYLIDPHQRVMLPQGHKGRSSPASLSPGDYLQ